MHAVAATRPQSAGGLREIGLSICRLPRNHIVIAVAVSLLYSAVLTLNVSVLLQPPRLSLELSRSSPGQSHIGWILPGGYLWSHGVRPGDQILLLDGAPVRNETGYWKGTSVVVRTGGRILRLESSALEHGRTTWPLMLLSPWFFLLGTLVLLRATPPAVGRATYALFTSAAFALALGAGADNDNLLAAGTEVVVIPLFAFAFARFFLLFPVLRRRRGRTSILALPALATGALGLAELIWPRLYAPVNILQLVVLLAYLLIGIALLVRGVRGTHDPALRHGLAVLGIGTVISILPFSVLSIAPELFGDRPPLPPEEAILALAVLPVCFSYAVLRYHILRVPLIQRWLVQAVAWGALAVLFGALIEVLFSLSGTRLPVHPDLLAASILVLIAGLSIRRLHDRISLTLDRMLFKDAYDYRGSLHRLSQDLSLAGDLDAVSESLPGKLCRLMNLEFAALLIQEEQGVQLQGTSGHCPLALLVPFVAAREADDKPRLMAMTDDERPSLLVPLRVGDTVAGYLCLGAKLNGEPFRAVDHDLLSTLGGHLATLVQNAQLMKDLRHNVRALDVLNDRLEDAQEAERSRLAAELHDEPLQTALQLHRLLAASGDDEAANLSRAIVGQLRAVCTAMRPPVLDDLGLIPALEALVFEAAEHDGLSVTLDTDGASLPVSLPPDLELVLYRAAQEALTNCRRHADATDIRVSLEWRGDTVQLRVVDNGSGFAVPHRLDSLATDGHLGLAGLEHRVARVGGRLSVRSQQGGGTTVQVHVTHGQGVS